MILTSNAYAPNGKLLRRGQTLPADVGKEFRESIGEFLVDEKTHPLLRLDVTSVEAVEAAWRTVHEHDPAADPLVSVAADRVRHAAEKVGAYRIAQARPFRDAPFTPAEPVQVTGRSTRRRDATS